MYFSSNQCKKQLGKSSIEDKVLVKYINKYSDFLKRQVLLLDADIIVCCGCTEKTGNRILNFIKGNCYNLEKVNDWIYYNNSLNKVVIDSYHLSARWSKESFYNDLMKAYYDFLQNHAQFLNIKR